VRGLEAYSVKGVKPPALPAIDSHTAGVALESPLLGTKQTLVLEEHNFPVRALEEVAAWGAWLAENAFPNEPAYQYWREKAGRGVVVLPEGSYRYFVRRGTQVTPRIRIDPRLGTAAEGSLWSEEFLPPETLLYTMVGINLPAETPSIIKKPSDVMDWLKDLASGYLQVGSGRTLGHGIVRAHWSGKPTKSRPARKPSKK
jgi:CRISPR-associated protein Cmr4